MNYKVLSRTLWKPNIVSCDGVFLYPFSQLKKAWSKYDCPRVTCLPLSHWQDLFVFSYTIQQEECVYGWSQKYYGRTVSFRRYLYQSASISDSFYHFYTYYFERLNRPVAVLLCRYTFGFAGILDSEIMSMNHIAKEKGVTIGMKAKDAVILCEEGKDQTI